MSRELDKRVRLQGIEFDACSRLAKEYRRIQMTPPVDDDYPEVRHDYERAVIAFLRACRDNGRQV